MTEIESKQIDGEREGDIDCVKKQMEKDGKRE